MQLQDSLDFREAHAEGNQMKWYRVGTAVCRNAKRFCYCKYLSIWRSSIQNNNALRKCITHDDATTSRRPHLCKTILVHEEYCTKWSDATLPEMPYSFDNTSAINPIVTKRTEEVNLNLASCMCWIARDLDKGILCTLVMPLLHQAYLRKLWNTIRFIYWWY